MAKKKNKTCFVFYAMIKHNQSMHRVLSIIASPKKQEMTHYDPVQERKKNFLYATKAFSAVCLIAACTYKVHLLA